MPKANPAEQGSARSPFQSTLVQFPAEAQALTWLDNPWLSPQVGQVHIGFPAIYYGIGVFACPVSGGPVCHGHLEETSHSPLISPTQFRSYISPKIIQNFMYIPRIFVI